jgi:formate--tetrahydrofolate ligase
MVATVRALKMHGGVLKTELSTENITAVKQGLPNLMRHVSNIVNVYKLPCVVAINRFPTDTDAEIETVRLECEKLGVKAVLSTVWADGGKGAIDLAKEVINLCEKENSFEFSYPLDCSIKEKLNAVVTKIYGGDGVEYTKEAEEDIARLTANGFDKLPVCIAKTQYSFSDDAKKICAPANFKVTVRKVKISAGAGFLVALTGNIMTMPGLPKVPSATKIDVSDDGKIEGLF